ncbi:hypothetical protein HN011_001599 [Eciton burchellii]|nr:hypothetical protein HN011_001599 [Eciton burchellii]
MARKIPAKKHRGVKDPLKQRAKRLAELDSCTNAPPKNVDEQAIPKSLEHVIKLKEAAKNSSGIVKRKRKKKKNALICVGQQHPRSNLHPKAKPEKVVPVFQQKPGESGRRFLNRVTRDTEAFIKETAFEAKYGVQIDRDPTTGQIQGLTKCKRKKDDAEILQLKHQNIKRKKTPKDSATLTYNEKRKLKLRLKKEKKLQDNDNEFDKFQDKVAFGEVAHEPPRLTIKMKKANEERKPKELLLNSLLQKETKISSPLVIDRTAKRKKLPATERNMLERQQSEAIAAYRRLKSQRSAN